jgi:mannose-1-phosphate guanylyltransferase/mannose-6-phosphate isomerase
MKRTLIPIILSGGSGARLWPISRESHPKPFMTLPDGESLLQKTYTRACQFLDVSEVITITNKEYYLKSKAEYENAHVDKRLSQHFLLEPYARNTAPAIALAALKITHEHGGDAIMLILPADHLITPLNLFTDSCEQAFNLAERDMLVTFGMTPTAPETGYGYIECGDQLPGDTNSRYVKRFIEKPNAETASSYVASPHYLWNSGMFCFKASTILEQFAELAPELLDAAKNCWQTTLKKNTNNLVLAFDEATFSVLENISIDYAIMEKSDEIAVIACDFNWQDIGSWEAYKKLFTSDLNGNTILGDVVMIDSHNNFIHSETRMVASIGISNLAIIDTPDAMLITHRDRAQEVKQIVQTLKFKAHESVTTHRTVIRPWGTYTVLEEGPSFKIKRISVKAGASLSLQKHQHRSEHWVVVEGTATIVIGEETFELTTNQSTFVPMNTAHRLSNLTSEPLIIIEVQTGSYLGEDDILRLEDTYGRV